tara:strand:- start:130 stop:282 length:153 start_codon:yes stop_codon:yes gene_type:complete
MGNHQIEAIDPDISGAQEIARGKGFWQVFAGQENRSVNSGGVNLAGSVNR